MEIVGRGASAALLYTVHNDGTRGARNQERMHARVYGFENLESSIQQSTE